MAISASRLLTDDAKKDESKLADFINTQDVKSTTVIKKDAGKIDKINTELSRSSVKKDFKSEENLSILNKGIASVTSGLSLTTADTKGVSLSTADLFGKGTSAASRTASVKNSMNNLLNDCLGSGELSYDASFALFLGLLPALAINIKCDKSLMSTILDKMDVPDGLMGAASSAMASITDGAKAAGNMIDDMLGNPSEMKPSWLTKKSVSGLVEKADLLDNNNPDDAFAIASNFVKHGDNDNDMTNPVNSGIGKIAKTKSKSKTPIINLNDTQVPGSSWADKLGIKADISTVTKKQTKPTASGSFNSSFNIRDYI